MGNTLLKGPSHGLQADKVLLGIAAQQAAKLITSLNTFYHTVLSKMTAPASM
jgi:hypothetical protein